MVIRVIGCQIRLEHVNHCSSEIRLTSIKKSYGRPGCNLSLTANWRKTLMAFFTRSSLLLLLLGYLHFHFEFDFFSIYAVVCYDLLWLKN